MVSKRLLFNAGKKCYEMTINGNKWTIEPQYPLDESFGVVVNCKPDFMFIPPRNKPGLKPIAVFTDGFQFHHYKADDDTLKRMAIIHSDKFRVWSLSWKDVNLSAKSHIDHAVRTLSYDNMPSPQMYLANVSNYNVADIDPSVVNAFELFLNYLGNEKAEDAFTMRSKAYAQALLSAEQSKSDVVRHVWFAKYSTIEKEVSISTIADHYDNYIIGENDPTQYGGIIELSCVDMNDYRTKKIDADFTVYIQLDDENVEDMKQYERRWNGFFYLINVMQFLGSSFVAVTKNGHYKGVYVPIMK